MRTVNLALEIASIVLAAVAIFLVIIGVIYNRSTARYLKAAERYRADDIAGGDQLRAEADRIKAAARRLEFWRRGLRSVTLVAHRKRYGQRSPR